MIDRCCSEHIYLGHVSLITITTYIISAASSINLQQGIFEGPSNQSDSGTALEMFGNRSFCFVSRLTPNSSISRGPRCYGVEPVTDGNNYAYSIMTNATVGSREFEGLFQGVYAYLFKISDIGNCMC